MNTAVASQAKADSLKEYLHQLYLKQREKRRNLEVGLGKKPIVEDHSFKEKNIKPLEEKLKFRWTEYVSLQLLLEHITSHDTLSKEEFNIVIELLKKDYSVFVESCRDYSRDYPGLQSLTSIVRNAVKVFWKLHFAGREDIAKNLIEIIAALLKDECSNDFVSKQKELLYDALVMFVFTRYVKADASLGSSFERELLFLASNAHESIRDKVLVYFIGKCRESYFHGSIFENGWVRFRRILVMITRDPKEIFSKVVLHEVAITIMHFAVAEGYKPKPEDEHFLRRAKLAEMRIELAGFRKWLDGKDLVIHW